MQTEEEIAVKEAKRKEILEQERVHRMYQQKPQNEKSVSWSADQEVTK